MSRACPNCGGPLDGHSTRQCITLLKLKLEYAEEENRKMLDDIKYPMTHKIEELRRIIHIKNSEIRRRNIIIEELRDTNEELTSIIKSLPHTQQASHLWKQRAVELREQGLTHQQIAIKLGRRRETICRHLSGQPRTKAS